MRIISDMRHLRGRTLQEFTLVGVRLSLHAQLDIAEELLYITDAKRDHLESLYYDLFYRLPEQICTSVL